MSIAGILSSSLSQLVNSQSKVATRSADFKMLGEDLQSGNLAAAQNDFLSLSKNNSAPAKAASSNAIVALKQAFGNLQTSLNSGDISGAQKAYSDVQQDFQSLSSQMHRRHTPRPVDDSTIQTSGTATDPASSAAALIDMLVGITNSNAASAYNKTNSFTELLGPSPLNAAA